MVHDARLPSVSTKVAGVPVPGSWWGHPSGKAIYDVLGELGRDRDVITAKLINAKHTLVDRALFDAFAALCAPGQPWQTEGLSPRSNWLAEEVRRRGRIRSDALLPPVELAGDLKQAARDAEERLIVRARSVHTQRGNHVRELEIWHTVMLRRAANANALTSEAAREEFETIARRWEKAHALRIRLPWSG
jgi:hypothetical protein